MKSLFLVYYSSCCCWIDTLLTLKFENRKKGAGSIYGREEVLAAFISLFSWVRKWLFSSRRPRKIKVKGVEQGHVFFPPFFLFFLTFFTRKSCEMAYLNFSSSPMHNWRGLLLLLQLHRLRRKKNHLGKVDFIRDGEGFNTLKTVFRLPSQNAIKHFTQFYQFLFPEREFSRLFIEPPQNWRERSCLLHLAQKNVGRKNVWGRGRRK